MPDDRMNKKDAECFETEVGTPTLTVELEAESRMLPWGTFQDAVLNDEGVLLRLSPYEIRIEGDLLGDLWKSIQLQDVRVIRKLDSVADGETHVRSLSMEKIEPEEADS